MKVVIQLLCICKFRRFYSSNNNENESNKKVMRRKFFVEIPSSINVIYHMPMSVYSENESLGFFDLERNFN